jgi:hypothetical protein
METALLVLAQRAAFAQQRHCSAQAHSESLMRSHTQVLLLTAYVSDCVLVHHALLQVGRCLPFLTRC